MTTHALSMAAVPNPAVTIDHTAFPTILDTIIAHSCVGALLALRATSKPFLERCNRLLVGHIVLEYDAVVEAYRRRHRRGQVSKVDHAPPSRRRWSMLLPSVRIIDQMTKLEVSLLDSGDELHDSRFLRRLLCSWRTDPISWGFLCFLGDK